MATRTSAAAVRISRSARTKAGSAARAAPSHAIPAAAVSARNGPPTTSAAASRRPARTPRGELAGIGDASEESEATLNAPSQTPPEDQTGVRERDLRGADTDQPPRMGGPLGSDANDPHLPEGAQDAETRGTGAGGFDRGVNAKVIGAVHQGAREEDPRSTTEG
jgi:hypothetical protein